MGWGEFIRQLDYKIKTHGNNLMKADRFYASSKICSCCGWENKELTLKDRVFICPMCGLVMDRDLNASKNLEHLIDNQNTVGFTGINVCPDLGCPKGHGEERLQPSASKAVLLDETETYTCLNT